MNFDVTPNRAMTNAFKWKKYAGSDILPMWVADTEFRCAQPILDALSAEIQHGVLGYTLPAQHTGANQAVIHWLNNRYNWSVESDWIVWTPGVVPAFNVATKAVCKKGDKIITVKPNYPPLLAAPSLHGCERLDVDSIEVDGRWSLDFETLIQHAEDPATKLFIMCNPMNPVGSVLTQAELDRVAQICMDNNVILCSDEIHCDLILSPECSHIPASSHPQLADKSITLMAASKTFNIAGLGASFAIIPDRALRARFNRAAQGMIPWVNIMGLVATEAAFTLCDDWYQALKTYLRGNRDYLVQAINKTQGLRALTPQATFLLWVDASRMQLDNPQQWCEARGVGPSPGADFGDNQFFRVNFGCSRSQLETAVVRLKQGNDFSQP